MIARGRAAARARRRRFARREPQRAAKRVVPEHKLFKEHTGHEQHLCSLVARREMDKAAGLAKGASYVCHICGRAAAKAQNLCEPVEI